MSNFWGKGYYSYHYNHLTTQLLDDLTRFVVLKFVLFMAKFFLNDAMPLARNC